MSRKTKIKFSDFECNLLINGMNEFRNMLLAEDLPTEDVDELLLKIVEKVKNKEIVIMSNRNSISYRRVGDYLIPNLILPPKEASVTLGKWGMLHKNYLLKHKKVLFTTLLTQGKLYQHCAEVEKQAQQMFDTLVEQMKKAEGATEHLKEENQMTWVCRMQNIEARAREFVGSELIFR